MREIVTIVAAAAAVSVAGPALGQCERWLPGQGAPGLSGGNVNGMVSWDRDGAGPLPPWLIAVGSMTVAGDAAVNGIAAWDGDSWSSLSSFTTTLGKSAAVFQGVPYLGGNFRDSGGLLYHLARWNGETFIGVSGAPSGGGAAMCVYRGELYSAATSEVAAWDGTQWRHVALVSGVRAMTVYNDELIVGGVFTSAGGVQAARIAAYNGTAWRALGPGVSGPVEDVAVYNGELIATGTFTGAGSMVANKIARWNGVSWAPLGTGQGLSPSTIGGGESGNALCVIGGDLYLAGAFSAVDGVPTTGVARWDGLSWNSAPGLVSSTMTVLAEHEGELAAGGVVYAADGRAACGLAFWNGSAWRPDPTPGLMGDIDAGVAWNDRFVVSGVFRGAGTAPAQYIAAWDGSGWAPLGDGLGNPVTALAVYDGDLIAGGRLERAGAVAAHGVARWDGSAWHAMGGGLSDGIGRAARIDAMAVYRGELYAAGGIARADGQPAAGIAKWNGSAWSPVGSGLLGGAGGPAPRALAVYNDLLVVGGRFTMAGGVPVQNLAAWNGTTWLAIGAAPGASFDSSRHGVHALGVYQGELYAAGDFTQIDASGEPSIAAWNGSSWRSLTPSSAPLYPAGTGRLMAYGDSLYFGRFGTGGPGPVVRWNGAAWSAAGGDVDDQVTVMDVYRGALTIAGWFTSVGGEVNSHWARWTDGRPVIADEPDDVTASVGETVSFSASVHASDDIAWMWRKDGAALEDGPSVGGGVISGARTGTLTIAGAGPADAGEYEVTAQTACGSATGRAATLTIGCAADLTGDGLIDFGDYLEFLNLYEELDLRIDYTQDGLVDFADYLEFLNLYEQGC